MLTASRMPTEDSFAYATIQGMQRLPRTTNILTGAARIAGITGLAAAGVLVGAAMYASERLNRRPAPVWLADHTFSPFETQVEGYETVRLTTEDGIRLQGWWLPRPDSQQVVVALGGHHSAKSDMLGIGSALWRAGNNVLIFDWRSRGQSDVAQHSLAYYELRDAEAAVRYALGRVPNAHLGVIGYSMGASVAVLLAARMAEIRAVVADSPFTGIREIVEHGAIRYRLPTRLLIPVADAINGVRYGYRFGSVRPIDAVAMLSPRPLFLIHGGADQLIPVSHAQQIFAAAREPKQLWIYEGVDHCGAYFADRVGYCQRVAAFFEQYLGSSKF